MPTATQVARHLLATRPVGGRMELMKLVYYAQAWNLAWEGKPLFNEAVEAWSGGPVVRSVFQAARYDAFTAADDEPLDAQDAAVVDAVADYYGRYSGGTLSAMTHSEAPWREARGNLPAGASSNCEIPVGSIRRFHTRQALNGEGPAKRAASEVGTFDDADISAVAGYQANRWQATLAILAR